MAIADGLHSQEANALRELGFLPGNEPRRQEVGPTVDVHREQQTRARAEARARLAASYGGAIPSTLPGRCDPS